MANPNVLDRLLRLRKTTSFLDDVLAGNLTEEDFLKYYPKYMDFGMGDIILNIEPKYYPIITPAMYGEMNNKRRFDLLYEAWSREQAILKNLMDLGD